MVFLAEHLRVVYLWVVFFGEVSLSRSQVSGDKRDVGPVKTHEHFTVVTPEIDGGTYTWLLRLLFPLSTGFWTHSAVV